MLTDIFKVNNNDSISITNNSYSNITLPLYSALQLTKFRYKDFKSILTTSLLFGLSRDHGPSYNAETKSCRRYVFIKWWMPFPPDFHSRMWSLPPLQILVAFGLHISYDNNNSLCFISGVTVCKISYAKYLFLFSFSQQFHLRRK